MAKYALAFICLLFVSCSRERPERVDLLLLYTSDVMNYTLPYDFLHEQPSEVSLANFATCANQRRKEYGENCIVLDNGNKILGTVPAGYYNFEDTKSEPLAFRVERLVNYDAVGIGDKDLDVPVLLDRTRWSPKKQPPVLCANLIDSETGKPVFQPYKIFERQGLRIAVLGLMSPNILAWIPQEDRHGIEVEDMIECASRWMPEILCQQPDLVVGLCGASLKYQDHGDGIDTYKNANGSVPTAIRVPGFDVMLMGGSPEREIFEVVNDAGQNVICVQTGSTCTHCGEVRISMIKDQNDTYQKAITASIVDLKQFPPDYEYCQQLSGVRDTLCQWLQEEIGELGDTIIGSQGFYECDFYRQLIHRAQLWFTGADISFACNLIGNDTILPGPITTRTLFKIFPYANSVELIEMQGQDIISFLEYSCHLQFNTLENQEDNLLLFRRDNKGNILQNQAGRYYLENLPRDFASAAGIRYTVDVSKPEGQRVRVLSMADGSPFNPRANYRVAINSYQGKDGGSYFSKGLGWDRSTLQLHAVPRSQFSVRYAIQEYIKAMGGEPIRKSPAVNWTLVPESLVGPVIEREKKAMHPTW